uniref:unspecific monooxygenase n=1 Tax=Manduca sexta TaxID=7130 RepID=D5L0N2_MANSE|nr:cytochrome P450 332A4 [Manduca sexta]
MDVGWIGVLAQIILLLLIIIISVVYIFFHIRYRYWKRRGVHYEKPFLFFGNLRYVMRKSFWEMFNELRKKNKRDYYGIFLAWQPTLVVQTPEYVRKILVKDYDHFENRLCYSSLQSDPLGSLNLFTLKAPLWSTMRHELSPMFTSKRLKMLTDLMNVNAKELVLKIKRENVDKNEPANLKELLSMYTSDTVGYTVFGIYVSALNDPSSPLWYITRHMVKWTFWRGFEFTMIFFIPYLAKVLRLTFFSDPATDYVKKLFWDTVNERKAAGKLSDKDLVHHLLQMKQNLKLPADADSDLAENLMMAQAAVFILGSIETSSTTISYCLHELAHHPEIQETLYQEIDEAFKRAGKDVLNYDELMELKYLTACIHETLRKYPPTPHLDRCCTKDYQLNDNLLIEAGTPVFVNVIGIHYNEEYYPEPEKWNPERMMNMSDNDNRNYTFIPFGEGPHFCIGKRYGLMQIRACLSQMVHKFKFAPTPEEPYEINPDPYSVLLAPKSGGRVKFISR